MLIRRRDGSPRAQTAIHLANNVDFRIGRSMVHTRVYDCSDSLAKSLITGRLLLAMNKETINPFRLSIFSLQEGYKYEKIHELAFFHRVTHSLLLIVTP